MEEQTSIQRITEEVMRRILKLLQEKDFVVAPKKEKILFLSNNSKPEKDFTLRLLHAAAGANYELINNCSICNKQCTECGNCSNILEECSTIIIDNLSNKELVNISLGITKDYREELINTAMLMGKKLYIISDTMEYKRYKGSCNKEYYKLYENYQGTVSGYGINVLNREALINSIQGDKSMECNESCDLKHKNLLCEADLRKVTNTGNKNIKVSEKTILTPLAKDFIRRNKLNLIKE